MAFFAGLAEGFVTGRQMKAEKEEKDRLAEYRKSEQDYRTGRDALKDRLAADALTYARGRDTRADKLAADQLEVTRTVALLELMPPNLTSALGGSGGDTNKGPVPSAGAIGAGGSKFTAQYEGLSDEDKNSPFFKAASSDVATQATLIAFMEAQAKKGNTVTLDQLPKYFNYLGAVEGKGEVAAAEFMNSMLSGDSDVTDTDTFIKGLKALKGYKSTEQLFMQTGAPQDITDATQQIQVWENAVEVDAYRAMQDLKGDKKQEVQRALAMLERKENRTQGLDILAKYGFGANAVQEYNMGDNPVIKSYYNSSAPTAAAPNTNTVVEPNTNTVVAADDVTVFNSWTEVEAARNEGYSGLVSVGGVSYTIDPLPGAAGAAPIVEESVDTSTPPEEAFLGTGFQLEEENNDTAIDAMFAETVEGPLAVPADAEQWVSNRPTINESPDVDMAEEVKSLEASTTVEDAMAALKKMNIEMPTNREELGFFKEDLKSVVYESGANVSDTILKGIIAVAAENSTKGETMQDQTNPPPAEAREPIVKRRKPKVKEMTSSDRARLKRAQKAGELRGGESDLLNMLVEKYGSVIVQKEMGL